MKQKGLWVTPHEFVSFSESEKSLSSHIATRSRSIDFASLSTYLPNPDPILKALGKDITVYRDLCSDAHVGGCIRRRKASVKALEWGINREIAKNRVSKNIEAIFNDLPIHNILSEMLDAALFGYQPLEVIWKKTGSFIVPDSVSGRPPEWFVYDADNCLRFRTKENSINGELLPEHKFLVVRQDATYDNPYGRPDLAMVFWPATFKRSGLKFWIQFTEKYGSPWVIGKHPRNTSDTETNDLLDRLEDMVQDAVAVIPNDSSVEIMEAAGKAGSADVYNQMLTFCKAEIAIALLGQNQTTEATANLASATAGLKVTDDIRDADAAMVSTAFNTLIQWICTLNFGSVPKPSFSMWEQEDVDKQLAERDEILTKAGAKFSHAYFRRAYGFQEGDLIDDASANVNFSESNASFPDQDAIDDAIDATLAKEAVFSDVIPLLKPVLKLVQSGATSEELLSALSDIYPDMDSTALQDRLARIIFVSEMWGRLNA